LENFLLITIIAVLLLYFFSSANVYKSLYRKVNEEKNILQDDLTKLEILIDRYEKQVKISSNTLKTNQSNLQVARDDLQSLRVENINLKNRVDDLKKRNEELYAQVNTMV
jgi:predicted  nucleic acid-binding Zn-ribbon protein